MPYQYGNEANPAAHYNGTAVEILEELDEVAAFVAGLGTGGTLMGNGRRLKETFGDAVKIVAAEPMQGEPVQGLRSLDDGFIPPIIDLSPARPQDLRDQPRRDPLDAQAARRGGAVRGRLDRRDRAASPCGSRASSTRATSCSSSPTTAGSTSPAASTRCPSTRSRTSSPPSGGSAARPGHRADAYRGRAARRAVAHALRGVRRTSAAASPTRRARGSPPRRSACTARRNVLASPQALRDRRRGAASLLNEIEHAGLRARRDLPLAHAHRALSRPRRTSTSPPTGRARVDHRRARRRRAGGSLLPDRGRRGPGGRAGGAWEVPRRTARLPVLRARASARASASARTAACRSSTPRRAGPTPVERPAPRAQDQARSTPRAGSSRSPARGPSRRPSSSQGLLLEEGIPSMLRAIDRRRRARVPGRGPRDVLVPRSRRARAPPAKR